MDQVQAARLALAWLADMGMASPVSDAPQPFIGGAKPQSRPVAGLHFADLAALYAAIEAFEGCPLKKTATRTVIADGNPAAPLMIIGEAPGADEDRQGKPFVGKAGQLLDRMLAAIGRARHHGEAARAAYISNVVFWRPPGNRAPEPAEMEACAPFVREHVRLIAPKVILALGATAAKALTGKADPLRAIRGQRFTYADTPLLVTYHPSYLLRTPEAKALVYDDLLALDAMLETLSRAD